ncbi:hypothetical protein [Streptomyces sp. NPDC000229]|uniref:hypothetical protein n=1 Tax=Streptomyces sp. NPDC000229 TaxID=3154247 RepID=UPI003332DA60
MGRLLRAGTKPSRPRNSDPAVVAPDYGLSQRVLITVSGRTGDVAELLPADSPPSPPRLQALDEPTVRAVVRQADRDVRTAPPPHPPIRRRSPRSPRRAASSTTSPPACGPARRSADDPTVPAGGASLRGSASSARFVHHP